MPYVPTPDARGLVELSVAYGIPRAKIQTIVEHTYSVSLGAREFDEVFAFELSCGAEITGLKVFGQTVKTAMTGDSRAGQAVLDHLRRLGIDTGVDNHELVMELLQRKMTKLGRYDATIADDGEQDNVIRPPFRN